MNNDFVVIYQERVYVRQSNGTFAIVVRNARTGEDRQRRHTRAEMSHATKE
jgi:hypothetical protein